MWLHNIECPRCKWTWEEEEINIEPDNTGAWLWEDVTQTRFKKDFN